MGRDQVIAVLELVKAIVSILVPDDEVTGVTARVLEGGGVEIVIHPATRRAAGLIIGKRGETINAIRHLASRAGQVMQPRLNVVAVTVADVAP